MAKSQCYELNNLLEPSQTSAIFWFFCCDRHICLHAMPDILDELHANCFLVHLSVQKTPTTPFPSYTIHGGGEQVLAPQSSWSSVSHNEWPKNVVEFPSLFQLLPSIFTGFFGILNAAYTVCVRPTVVSWLQTFDCIDDRFKISKSEAPETASAGSFLL